MSNSTGNSTILTETINVLLTEGFVFTATPYEPDGWGGIFACVFFSFSIFFVPGILACVGHVKRRMTGEEEEEEEEEEGGDESRRRGEEGRSRSRTRKLNSGNQEEWGRRRNSVSERNTMGQWNGREEGRSLKGEWNEREEGGNSKKTWNEREEGANSKSSWNEHGLEARGNSKSTWNERGEEAGGNSKSTWNERGGAEEDGGENLVSKRNPTSTWNKRGGAEEDEDRELISKWNKREEVDDDVMRNSANMGEEIDKDDAMRKALSTEEWDVRKMYGNMSNENKEIDELLVTSPGDSSTRSNDVEDLLIKKKFTDFRKRSNENVSDNNAISLVQRKSIDLRGRSNESDEDEPLMPSKRKSIELENLDRMKSKSIRHARDEATDPFALSEQRKGKPSINSKWSQIASTICRMVGDLIKRFFYPLRRRDRDLEKLGVEGASILLFEREVGLYLLFCAFVVNTILVPIHVFSPTFSKSPSATDRVANILGALANDHIHNDFVACTIQHVPARSRNLVLWIHVAFVYFLTWTTLKFQTRLTEDLKYIERRHDALSNTAANRKRCPHSLYVSGRVRFFPLNDAHLERGLRLIFDDSHTGSDDEFDESERKPIRIDRIFKQLSRARDTCEFQALVTFEDEDQANSFLSHDLRRASLTKRLLEFTITSTKDDAPLMRMNAIEAVPVAGVDAEFGDDVEAANMTIVNPRTPRTPRLPVNTTTQANPEKASVSNIKFLSSLGMDEWNVSRAPDANDVIWGALQSGKISFYCRSLLVNAGLAVSLFLFTTPIAFLTFASAGDKSDDLRSVIESTFSNFVQNFKRLSPSFGDFMFGFLPQVILVFCDAWLLFILQVSSKLIEPHQTHSGRETSLFRKSFAFLLFNTLLLPSLALSNVGSLLGDLVKNEKGPFSLLGRVFVTSSGAFTLTFIATQTWVGAAMDLSRVSERLWVAVNRHARRYLPIPKSSALHHNELNTVSPRFVHRHKPGVDFDFDYGSEYALSLTILSLCLVFATSVPPIFFFASCYFFVKQATDAYCLRHLIAPQPVDRLSRAFVARAAVRHFHVPLILFQSTLFGFCSSEVCLPRFNALTASVMSSLNASIATASVPATVPCIGPDGNAGRLVIRGSELQLAALLVCLTATTFHYLSLLTKRALPSHDEDDM